MPGISTLQGESIPPPPLGPLSLSRSPNFSHEYEVQQRFLNDLNSQRIDFHRTRGYHNGQCISTITISYRRTDNGEIQRIREEVFYDNRPTTISETII